MVDSRARTGKVQETLEYFVMPGGRKVFKERWNLSAVGQIDPSYMSEKNHNCPVVSTCAESLNSEIQMQVMNQFSKTAGRCITQHSTHNFRGNSQAPRLPRHPTKSP